jgi:hypothetical protein
MKKTKKIYLPKWQRWYIAPMMIGIWLFITYIEFFSNSTDKMGTVGYVFISLILLLPLIMIWKMTNGDLPAYIIEEDDEK